jgi:hypothetical protein
MALTARASTTVQATPREVLEFVLDMERYRQADHKIRHVSSVDGPDKSGAGSVKMWGRLRWGPATPDRQNFHLDRWQRLTLTGAPRQPARLVFDFVGTFECEPTEAGTLVTHAYEFTFHRPFRLMEPFLREWLQTEIEAEVDRIAEIL